jgi:hypothetical protein
MSESGREPLWSTLLAEDRLKPESGKACSPDEGEREVACRSGWRGAGTRRLIERSRLSHCALEARLDFEDDLR